MAARREIELEATPEDVWEALASEEGRAGYGFVGESKQSQSSCLLLNVQPTSVELLIVGLEHNARIPSAIFKLAEIKRRIINTTTVPVDRHSG